MIQVGTFNYVSPADVEAIIERAAGGYAADFPYHLVVRMKSGYEVTVGYKALDPMNRDAERLANAVKAYQNLHCLSADTVQMIVNAEMEKLRPYLRRIEKAVKGKENGA